MYDFMPRIERFRQAPDPDVDYDLIVVGDCGELERVGRLREEHAELFGRVPIVDIDHHGSNSGFGASTGSTRPPRRRARWSPCCCPRLGVPLDALDGAIAANLMAGVVIDTANFQHPNTTPRTLRVASGAAWRPVRRCPTSRGGSTAPSPTRSCGCSGACWRGWRRPPTAARVVDALDRRPSPRRRRPGESEGLIDLLAQSDTAEVAILFKDQGDRTRISVRTRDGGVDAIALTGAFGGGGHARAAGATIELPIDAAREPAVLAEAARLVDRLRGRAARPVAAA